HGEAHLCGRNPATLIRVRQHESAGIGRHSQHLQAERAFAHRHHGRIGVSRRQRAWEKGRTQMRKLIFAINTTLDGCVDHTKQLADQEVHKYFTQLLREVDLQVFGRRTYQLMVPYWPEVLKDAGETKADTEFARAFCSTNKVVFSRSLDNVGDSDTRIARGNLHDEILKLKQEKGKNILVGGVDIPSQLIQLGLVDES